MFRYRDAKALDYGEFVDRLPRQSSTSTSTSRFVEGGAMMNEAQAQTLWLSLPSVSDANPARLGIDRQVANRAGGLAWSRITTAGRAFDFDHGGTPAIIQPVWRDQTPSIKCAVEHPSWPI